MTEPIDAALALAEPAPLRQALVVHPEGTAEFTFLAHPDGEPIVGTRRGVRWMAFTVGGTTEAENPTATAFARSMGWDGDGQLSGTVVFVGDEPVHDVPGVLIAEAIRLWGDVPVN